MRCIQIALTILIRLWCICFHALLLLLLLGTSSQYVCSVSVVVNASILFLVVLGELSFLYTAQAHRFSLGFFCLFCTSFWVLVIFLWKIKEKRANGEWERWQVQTETTKINWIKLNGLDGESQFFSFILFEFFHSVSVCSFFCCLISLYFVGDVFFVFRLLFYDTHTQRLA